MKLLRLPAAKVKLGVPLPWNVRDNEGRLLLSKGQLLIDQAQLDALLARGAFVDVEDARAAESIVVSTLSSHVTAAAPKRSVNLFGMWDGLPNQMRVLMDELRGAQDVTRRVMEFVQSITEMVDKDVDIALYHTVRQENADLYFYGYSHAIQTAVLCLLMTRRLAWTDARRMGLMCAALTMNTSVLKLQGQLAKQDLPVRESQRQLIHEHPREALEWLQKGGVTDVDWLTAVAQHHERPDGTGYHLGLKDVAEMAVALRVTDVFMAKISPRTLRPPLPIKDAAKQLYGEDHGGPLSTAIIKEFGVFPPGEVVTLASGEMGVVMRRSGNPRCPIVACITDSAGQAVPRTVQRDTSKPEYAIVSRTPAPATISRLPPERIYGYASATGPT